MGYCNFGAAKKLQALTVSHMAEGYRNTNLTDIDLGNCQLLQSLEVCGCPNLATPLDFTGCPSLKGVDLRATGVTGVTFATGGYLESAMLPASVSSITGKQLDSLTSLALEGYESLRTLHLEYCSTVDSLSLITNATGLTRVRLLDVDWTAESAEAIVRLLGCGGIDDSGFDTDTAVLTGLAHIGSIGQTKLGLLTAAFPDFTIIYDTLAAEHMVRFLADDGVTVLDSQRIRSLGK